MKKRKEKIIISTGLFILSLLISDNLIKNSILIISYLVVGLDILRKALRNIKRGKIFDENFLMSVATIGAIFIGEYSEAVFVMLFYQIGEFFQSYAVDKSRKRVASLMDIRPDYANIERGKKIEKVDPNEVKIGQTIIVKPGEKVPLDGIVINGSSLLNTTALTGESVPRKVKVGDEVLSGCINSDGVIKIRVTQNFKESTVSKILDLVENASNRKSKSEDFITKFAKYYTPVVVIIALLLALLPPLITNDSNFYEWLYKALSFLVVSCPCALVISIPLSFFGGLGASSKIGVLVKGSNYLEMISNARILVCDKTGTLTEGVFEVQNINAINIEKKELLKIAVYAEYYSNHPIAISLKKAYKENINEEIIKKTKEISGEGISAIIDNKKVLVGNDKLMNNNKIEYQKNSAIGTVIYIAIDNIFKGSIVISDKIKEDSFKAIPKLKKIGIQKIIMLTGDKESISKSIANKLGINTYCSELLPNEKVQKVEELMKEKSEKNKLIFVGDGINDAPVLAISDIGIAMGGVGSDAAIESSDIVLMTDELSKIAEVINISKKTMTIVKENIILAISVKIVILLLSALGIATMWEAVFGDVGVMIIAILNALRILKVKTS